MFDGVYTALITPYKEDGKIDFEAMEKIIKAQISAGVDGLVLLGTTAETPCLSPKEKIDIILCAKALMPENKKIIIGIGSNSTYETVNAGKAFLEFNPDAYLVVTPYYSKPNPSGLIEHFKQVGELGKPIIMYHIPGRTGLRVSAKVKEDLVSAVPLIKAIKESDYDMANVTDTCVKLADKINIMAGNDDMLLQIKSLNGKGMISAAGNILCKAFVEMNSNPGKAFNIFQQIYDIVGACYYETNPTCVKYILSRLGFCREDVRTPLGPISAETRKRVDAVLEKTDKKFLLG